MTISVDKLSSLVLACSTLIEERELEWQQEITIVAVKAHRSNTLRPQLREALRTWLPSSNYLTYNMISFNTPSDN